MVGRRSTLTLSSKMLTVLLIFMLALPLLTACSQEAKEAAEALEAAKTSFASAVEALDEKNAAVDATIAELTEVMGSEIKPLDDATMTACEDAISAAQGAKVAAPEMAEATEDIQAQVEELNAVDYSEQLKAMDDAKVALENSIKQREQITNPTDAFVIQRLTGVEHIQSPTAVTEDMDPNGLLNKQGGYTATVYFLSDLVDQSQVYYDESTGVGNEVIDKGTEGGGAVEVYATEDEANKRNDYLATYDGSILASGSHNVYGTCLIRTSDYLTASQQKDLEAAIVEALTRLE